MLWLSLSSLLSLAKYFYQYASILWPGSLVGVVMLGDSSIFRLTQQSPTAHDLCEYLEAMLRKAFILVLTVNRSL